MSEEEIGDEPPEGDIAWIWFRPVMPVDQQVGCSRTLGKTYHAYCEKCDTYGVKDPFHGPRRCWCCGRFISGPTAAPPLMSKYFI